MLFYFTKKKYKHKKVLFSMLMFIIADASSSATVVDNTDLSYSQNSSNTLVKIASVSESRKHFIANEQQDNNQHKAPVINLSKQAISVNQPYKNTTKTFYDDTDYPDLAINNSVFNLYPENSNSEEHNDKRISEYETEIINDQASLNKRLNQHETAANLILEGTTDNSNILEQLYNKVLSLEHEIANIKEAQRNNCERYIDIDQRIMSLHSELYSKNYTQNNVANNTTDASITGQIELTRSDINHSVYQAKVLVQKQEYSQAIKILTKTKNTYPATTETLDQHPELFNVYFWIAEINMHLEHYDTALTAFKNMERIFKKHDRISEVSYKIGILLRNKGDIKESNTIFKNIINKYPESSVANIVNKILNQ